MLPSNFKSHYVSVRSSSSHTVRDGYGNRVPQHSMSMVIRYLLKMPHGRVQQPFYSSMALLNGRLQKPIG